VLRFDWTVNSLGFRRLGLPTCFLKPFRELDQNIGSDRLPQWHSPSLGGAHVCVPAAVWQLFDQPIGGYSIIRQRVLCRPFETLPPMQDERTTISSIVSICPCFHQESKPTKLIVIQNPLFKLQPPARAQMICTSQERVDVPFHNHLVTPDAIFPRFIPPWTV
jgi:hypothetical protein